MNGTFLHYAALFFGLAVSGSGGMYGGGQGGGHGGGLGRGR